MSAQDEVDLNGGTEVVGLVNFLAGVDGRDGSFDDGGDVAIGEKVLLLGVDGSDGSSDEDEGNDVQIITFSVFITRVLAGLADSGIVEIGDAGSLESADVVLGDV